MASVLTFLREFRRPRPQRVIREETTYRRGAEDVPATLYRPARGAGPFPGWVTLHGLTYSGRNHDSLRRLAHALAASGSVVLVPDIPEWRRLRVEPGATVETIKAAVLALDAGERTEPGRVGVMGFSFGATQALVAATDPSLAGHLAGVAAWGGYADMDRVLRFAFLGEHELDGRVFRLEPDPYGRWILAGNYLTLVPEHRHDDALADALLSLALEAGRTGILAWDPAMDPAKLERREKLEPRQRELFDLIAPRTGTALDPDGRDRAEALARRLVEAATARDPLLDPTDHLPAVPVPVFLAHGRGDRLMPWSEMVRLARALPPERLSYSGLTSLFGHSTGERRWISPGVVPEAVRFVHMMRRMLALIERP